MKTCAELMGLYTYLNRGRHVECFLAVSIHWENYYHLANRAFRLIDTRLLCTYALQFRLDL